MDSNHVVSAIISAGQIIGDVISTAAVVVSAIFALISRHYSKRR